MRLLLSKLSPKHKLIFLILFGAAILIKLAHWYYYRSTIGLPTHTPMIFWESLVLLTLIFWNPKGIRIVLLALMGFFIFQLVVYSFFTGGMSSLPYWYLFRDVYGMLHLDSLYAFLTEAVILFSLTVSLFPTRKKQNTSDLIDDLD